MKRVYLDSNIYRYLKINQGNNSSLLFENLIHSKDEIMFYYSYAHLSDLSRDKTDRKFDDLLFMEQLVDSNFLNLNSDEVFVNVQIASPTCAYNSMNFAPINEVVNFQELFEDLEIKEYDSTELRDAKEKIKLIFNMPLSVLGIPNLADSIEENNPINKLLPALSNNGTFLDLIKGMLNTFHDLYENPTIWREFRNYSINSLGNKLFNIDVNDNNFNELLKETPLQKSFLEFVEEIFTHNKSLEKQREYNFFINSYNCLNILGLDKEENKKVVFSSFQNDAQHAYYGAHCQYLVSEDKQLLLKAKILYKLLGIETKVLNFEEFEELINQNKKKELSFDSFTKSLAEVFENGSIEEDFEIDNQSKRVLVYRLNHSLFNSFNRLNLIIRKNDSPMYIFYNETNNYSRFTSFVEFNIIINKIVSVLGTDIKGKNEFTDNDRKSIIEDNWEGRIWHFQNESFCLEVEQNEKKLCFYYLPLSCANPFAFI